MRRVFYLVLVLFLGTFAIACNDDDDDDENGEEESVCGDGVCDADEDADSCPEDCDDGGEEESVCGDGICDADEDADSCPEDCDDGGEPKATTCVATYQLDATMAIEGTPGGLGDAVAEELP